MHLTLQVVLHYYSLFSVQNLGSSVNVVTRLWAGWTTFGSRQGHGRNFFRQHVHTGSGCQPASYAMRTAGFFL